MVTLADKLITDALTLPNDVRAEIVDKLLESLNLPLQKDIDRQWAALAEKRLRDIKSGRVKTVPGSVVFEKIRNRPKAR
ncbi:MAG: addiction module protein [Fibrobacterota bacterium]